MRLDPALSGIAGRMTWLEGELQQAADELEQITRWLQADHAQVARLQGCYQEAQRYLADDEPQGALTTEMLLSLVAPLENSLLLLGQAMAHKEEEY